MGNTILKITKTLHQLTLWVHPEGLVHGSLYVSVDTEARPVEDPHRVLNTDWPFIVLRRHHPDEIRFYNRGTIIRAEYTAPRPQVGNLVDLKCRIFMMDGSVFEGEIHAALPPEKARLYDYLNQADDRFLKLYLQDDQVCLLNKSYITQVTP
ncbi:MAG: hypothetical protein HY080_01715 [Gammaproteobacteria bacterium]|nr:hypothetical protein [Gammaproteobacteria bacterium]